MSRGTTSAPRIVHSPLLLDWTEEKLRTLDQEQLLNLLANLDHQRSVGRVSDATAEELEKRITAFLTKRNITKRRAATSG